MMMMMMMMMMMIVMVMMMIAMTMKMIMIQNSLQFIQVICTPNNCNGLIEQPTLWENVAWTHNTIRLKNNRGFQINS